MKNFMLILCSLILSFSVMAENCSLQTGSRSTKKSFQESQRFETSLSSYVELAEETISTYTYEMHEEQLRFEIDVRRLKNAGTFDPLTAFSFFEPPITGSELRIFRHRGGNGYQQEYVKEQFPSAYDGRFVFDIEHALLAGTETHFTLECFLY